MKFAVILALVSVTLAAPQPRKEFHEHFDDFSALIANEVGDQIYELMLQYEGSEQFAATLDYLRTTNFRNLIYEMEDLPEFKAVQDFLDTHSVDISYFIDMFNNLLANMVDRKSRQTASGADFNSYVQDCTTLFPQDQLTALFEQKLAEDDDFRAAIEGLQSDEFSSLYSTLWESAVFQAEVQSLADNGIDLGLLLGQLVAMFGQSA